MIFALTGCSIRQADEPLHPDQDIAPHSNVIETGHVGRNNDELTTLEGVRLTTELDYYAEGTDRILAIWENYSHHPLMYGESWQLEKLDADSNEWLTVQNNDKTDIVFNDIGYNLSQGRLGKHTYYISIYDDSIKQGRYRIKTNFHDNNNTGTGLISYIINAEFTVTSDETLLKKSELDFVDIHNSREIFLWHSWVGSTTNFERGIDFPVRLYKNIHTYDTTIVINGEDYYSIAEGTGPWGVITANYFSADENKYLIYSYSREDENGEKLAYIDVFDLIDREVVFKSEAYKTYDITVNERDEGRFSVSQMTYFEDEYGGSGASLVREIGIMMYVNGEFKLYTVSD